MISPQPVRPVLASLLLALAPSVRADEPLIALRATRVADRGKAATFSLVVVPAPALRLLDDGPLVLDVDGTGLDPATRSLGRKDAVDPHAERPRFEIEVRARRDASPTLHAHLFTWVCRGTRCRPFEVDQAIPFDRGPTQ